jgi:two-component system, NarL family, invasion response regulator UvrY
MRKGPIDMDQTANRTNTIRVMLVDDHAMVRGGYRRLLQGTRDLQVVGEAGDARECLARFAECRPDVMVLDLSMPGSSGFDLIHRLSTRDPELKILVLSMHNSALTADRALRSGAKGYLTKSAEPHLLTEAVRRLYADEIFMDPGLASAVDMEHLGGRRGELAALTRREFEVFIMLAGGSPVSEVADALHISPKTAGIHYTRVMQKLGLRNLAELARLAIRLGVVDA